MIPAPSQRYRWWLIALLWVVCFLDYADRQALSSVLPLIARDRGFDAFQLGLIGSAFAWVYAAGAPLAGIAADRFSRRKLIIGACVAWSVFTFVTAWADGFTSLVIARALTGLGETFYFPAAMAMIAAYHGPSTWSRAMSWHQSAVYMGTVGGSWAAAAIAESFGWRMPFLVFGPIGIAYAALLYYTLWDPPSAVPEAHVNVNVPAPSFMGTLRRLISRPAVLLLMGGFLCANFVAVIFLTWTPLFLVEKFHFQVSTAGLSGTVFIQFASAAVIPGAGTIADLLVRRMRAGRMVVQGAGLVLGSVPIFIVGTTTDTTVLLVTMSLFGVCKGFYDSGIFASLFDVVEAESRGAAAGLMNTVGWIGGALGPVFVGFATKYGHGSSTIENMSHAIAAGGYVYLVAAALVMATAILYTMNTRTEQQ